MRNKKYKVLMTCSKSFYMAYEDIEKDMKKIGVEFVKVLSEEPIPPDKLKKYLSDIDIYIVAVEQVTREIIDSAPKLKYILKHGVGTDNIDVDYARKKGIVVTNAPGQNSDSVADMTMALLLSATRFITRGDAIIKNGGWSLLIGHELRDKILGIMGLGEIGRKVAARAISFGMKILAYDIKQDERYAREHNIEYVEKETLYRKSDFITICMSLNDKTRHLIDKSAFECMKPSTILVNTARGPIINEQDLIYALNTGLIAGAALDVYETEPPSKELIRCRNTITTPHIAGSTYECARRLSKIAVANIERYIKGQKLEFIV